MDLRDVVKMVASGYDWACPECGEENHEEGIARTTYNDGVTDWDVNADLRCQECGATFKNGGADHHYVKM